jgi:hypothetical protein
MTRRNLFISAILLLAVALGAAREFVFINLNYQIDHFENHRAFSYAHSAFQAVVAGWSLRSLVLLKWASAFACIALMLLLSLLLAHQLFGDRRYHLAVLLGFVTIGLVALALHLMASSIPALEGISVKLLHALQYPVVLLFLWAASGLRNDQG